MSEPRPSPRATEAAGTPAARAARPEFPGAPRVISSETLLDGAVQLAILHNETIYFLRQTRFGKLILTK